MKTIKEVAADIRDGDSMWNRTRIKFFCRNQYWNTASKMGTSG